MKRPLLLGIVAVAGLLAADHRSGLPARPNPQDYPAHASEKGITIAAHVLDEDTVRSSFATDLYRRYAVVEVAVYPPAGQTLDVADVDFGLKFDGKSVSTRPASPRSIAASIQRKAAGRRNDVTLHPNVGVGIGNDPYGGRSTGTSVGVGVGMGGNAPGPASTDEDREVMRSELEDRALQNGEVAKPVAGYLFFPLPNRKRVIAQELTFETGITTVRVPLGSAQASKH